MENNELLINKIDNQLFDIYWNDFTDNSLNKDFIKEIFSIVDGKYKSIISSMPPKQALIKNIGINEIVSYILEEHKFHLGLFGKEHVSEIEKDPKYKEQLVNICLDKLITNELSNVKARSVISKYSVQISSLEMYLNKMLILLSKLPLNKESTKQRLESDIYAKCILLLKSALDQLCSGLETEAMSSWRTFHELLCVLCVIDKSDEKVSQSYYRHLRYGAYSRGEIINEKEKAEIEQMMEKDMLDLEVKKANREKFINYGWIWWAYKTYNDKEVKLNFLGGLQIVAELEEYRKYYELSSDVTHSTPLLVYANKEFFSKALMRVVYKSFFKIETMLMNFASNELQMDSSNKDLKQYLLFRGNYKKKIEIIYQLICSK